MGETSLWKVCIGTENATLLNGRQRFQAQVNLNDVQTLEGPAKMLCRCDYVTPMFVASTSAFSAPMELRIGTIGQFQTFDSRSTSDMTTLAVMEPNDTLNVGEGSAAVTVSADQFSITYGTTSKTFTVPQGVYSPANLQGEIQQLVNAWLAANGYTQTLIVTYDDTANKFLFRAGTAAGANWTLSFNGVPAPMNDVLGFPANYTSTPADWYAAPLMSTQAVTTFASNDTFKGYKFGGGIGDTVVNREFLNQQNWLIEVVYTNGNPLQGDDPSVGLPMPLEDWMAVLSFRW